MFHVQQLMLLVQQKWMVSLVSSVMSVIKDFEFGE